MPRGREIIGLPVFHSGTGKRLGEVKDVILDEHGRRVEGLILEWGGWFHRPRVVPIEAIHSIGPDAIVTDREPSAEIPEATVSERKHLRGKRVFNQGGSDLGTLDDVLFGPDGTITGLRLSAGLIDDIISGKQDLSVSGTHVGQESIIVDELS